LKVAYVDTSCLVAIALSEKGIAPGLTRRINAFDELVSSNLLEAEMRAVFAREKVAVGVTLPFRVSWILPDRPLTGEIARVLAAGYVRGADCWHLATALYLTDDPSSLTFLTVDERQKSVAVSLGFEV
jgi:predicted nucleic acid-binding protein